MNIVAVTDGNVQDWAVLCNELWPDNPVDEMMTAYANGEYTNEFLYQLDGVYAAFISLSLRHDYVEGKEDDNPVGYIEGIYVREAYRNRGIARELVSFARQWSSEQGCTMLASDCSLDNALSRLFHRHTGFLEVGINVHFKMDFRA